MAAKRLAYVWRAYDGVQNLAGRELDARPRPVEGGRLHVRHGVQAKRAGPAAQLGGSSRQGWPLAEEEVLNENSQRHRWQSSFLVPLLVWLFVRVSVGLLASTLDRSLSLRFCYFLSN